MQIIIMDYFWSHIYLFFNILWVTVQYSDLKLILQIKNLSFCQNIVHQHELLFVM